MTVVSQTNILVGPSIALLLCAPKYIGGTMTLGAMVQAAAAFAVVQGAFSWVAESFGRLAEWAASARRVGSLLHSLDQIESQASEADVALSEHPVAVHAKFATPRRDLSKAGMREAATRIPSTVS
jgi:putative ATP-binding cassette transporter